MCAVVNDVWISPFDPGTLHHGFLMIESIIGPHCGGVKAGPLFIATVLVFSKQPAESLCDVMTMLMLHESEC
jgi:hypothetical protein